MTTVGSRLPRTELAFDVHDDVPEPEGGIVDDGLGEANAAAAPLAEVRGGWALWVDALRAAAFGRGGRVQAPSFYESLGYVHATEFRGFPHGIVKYVMVRHAVPTDGRPDPARGPRQRQRRG